ncbi:MAG: hypothetical protein ACHQQ3_14005, partial [Gemmatimonadales bacterium]
MPRSSARLAAFTTALLALSSLATSSSGAQGQITIDRWLVLGPVHAPVPFGSASDSALLDASRPSLKGAWPAEGSTWAWPGAGSLRWASGNGAAADGETFYAAAYVTADRWQHIAWTAAGGGEATRRLWIDGRRAPPAFIDLTPGKHWFLVERIGRAAGGGAPLTLTMMASAPGATLSASLDPRHVPTFRELHDVVAVGDVRLDDAAQKVAVLTRWQDA